MGRLRFELRTSRLRGGVSPPRSHHTLTPSHSGPFTCPQGSEMIPASLQQGLTCFELAAQLHRATSHRLDRRRGSWRVINLPGHRATVQLALSA